MTNSTKNKAVQIIQPEQIPIKHYSPRQMGLNLWRQRPLLKQLAKRQIIEQYRGSYLGLGWAVLTPLLMLVVYTFVFSVIFQARWGALENGNVAEFGLFLFAGLLVYNFFSESVLASPKLVVSKPNYVKRVVFPLELLSVSLITAVFVQSLFSLIILIVAATLLLHQAAWTILLLPLMYVPLTLFCLGLSWFFASLGVYLRDSEHVLRIVVQLLFFLTPVFYPVTAVPPFFQSLLKLNPLTHIIQFFRDVALLGIPPHWPTFWLMVGVAFSVCWLGYIWFMRSSKTFADVL